MFCGWVGSLPGNLTQATLVRVQDPITGLQVKYGKERLCYGVIKLDFIINIRNLLFWFSESVSLSQE